jgi:acyl-CoA thioester hydrolase
MPERPLPEFPATVTLPVQWGEQDGFGHINNMHFIRWFESARIAYMSQCGVQLTTQGVGPILAAVNCNYRLQVKYPDTIVVGARVTRLGRSSIQIEHQLWSVSHQAVAADGDSTVVMFDYENQASSPLTDELRETIRKLENNPSL